MGWLAASFITRFTSGAAEYEGWGGGFGMDHGSVRGGGERFWRKLNRKKIVGGGGGWVGRAIVPPALPIPRPLYLYIRQSTLFKRQVLQVLPLHFPL